MPWGLGERLKRGFLGRLWTKLGEGDTVLVDSPSEERKRRQETVVTELAEEFSRSGFGAVGLFMAEGMRPLGRLAATVLRVAEPSLGLVLNPRPLSNLACLLEDGANLERFARAVEDLDEQRGEVEAGRD